MRLIIAGGRDFNNYELLRDSVDLFIAEHFDPVEGDIVFGSLRPYGIEVVSGAARGADTLGEQYAKERGFKCIRFPANWDLYGKIAGLNRNLQMANYSTHCIVFWNGVSTGSQHMIKTAEKQGLITEIIKY